MSQTPASGWTTTSAGQVSSIGHDPLQAQSTGSSQNAAPPAASQGVEAAAIRSDSLHLASSAPGTSQTLSGQLQASQLQANQLQGGQSSAIMAAASESVTAASAMSSTPGVVRAGGRVGRLGPVAGVKELKEGQSTDSGFDLSAAMRDPAGARGAASPQGDAAGGKSDAAGGAASGDPFAALDGDNGAGQATWTHAGTQSAEAGFQDPSLGWVSVRADASGGGVHAQLVAGSADAAQALSGHMDGLNAYLADHHTQVASLTVSSPQQVAPLNVNSPQSPLGGWSGTGGNASSGQGMQQNAGQQGGGQQEYQQPQPTGAISAETGISSSLTHSALPTAAPGLAAWQGGMEAGRQTATPGGAYISVMA